MRNTTIAMVGKYATLPILLVALALVLLTPGEALAAGGAQPGAQVFMPLLPSNWDSAQLTANPFAPYVVAAVDPTRQAPDYTPDPNAVVNPTLIQGLTEAQRRALFDNGFVVVPQGYDTITDIYLEGEHAGIPPFVTSDALLHTTHLLFNYTLRAAEVNHFLPALEDLTQALLAAAEVDYAYSTGNVRDAAAQELAYLAVAARLLDPEATIPGPVKDVVQQELTLIEQAQGFAVSPIFGYVEDYSQYIPRGHYTRSDALQRYFRAMMWYSRMTFHLTDEDNPEAARQATRAALLLTRALHKARVNGTLALDVWQSIYEPTRFLVSAADDLTPEDYAQAARAVYGTLPDPAMLADEAQLDAFIQQARSLARQRVNDTLFTDQEDTDATAAGFRFLGKRFLPDAYILQELVYPRVGTYTGTDTPFTLVCSDGRCVRGFPRGLDIPAVLGSERALAILQQEGDTAYEKYDAQMAALRSEFQRIPTYRWTQSVYWGWLYALRPLLEPKGEGYPYFMRSPAWQDKDLQTWLGSWTELRHDTVLYAKDSYTGGITGVTTMSGYVEPQPEVYARMAALVAQLRVGMDERGLLSADLKDRLTRLENLLLTLKTISEKELRGESLSRDDNDVLNTIGTLLDILTTFPEDAGVPTSAADERMALVVDVHTDPNSQRVLEQAIGDAFPIYVVVLIDGQQVITRGGVFSYYEFTQPMSQRLTDEAWQAMSPRPPRPLWTASFIVE